MPKIQPTHHFFLVIITAFITSCEGLKILTLYNKTGKEITIETRPEITEFKHTPVVDTVHVLSPSKTYHLLPDSSLSLLTSFGWLLFNSKIKERDLPMEYLRIETSTDTIIANSRAEIIKLISNPKFKYRHSDKAYALDDNRITEAIIVRE